jgi:Nucleotidyltransferase of unknown function (DUF6036)
MLLDARRADELLVALGEQLALRDERHAIVVVGGSALIALGLVSRATRDIDVVAVLRDGDLVSAEPLPAGLLDAVGVVARDFRLPSNWLNTGPASLLDFGLPDGFLQRTERRGYGDSLEVLFASRLDQIHFKLYAAVDQGAGRHLTDLQALTPSEDELIQAARWSETHDPSDGYREILLQVLAHLGVEHGPPRA